MDRSTDVFMALVRIRIVHDIDDLMKFERTFRGADMLFDPPGDLVPSYGRVMTGIVDALHAHAVERLSVDDRAEPLFDRTELSDRMKYLARILRDEYIAANKKLPMDPSALPPVAAGKDPARVRAAWEAAQVMNGLILEKDILPYLEELLGMAVFVVDPREGTTADYRDWIEAAEGLCREWHLSPSELFADGRSWDEIDRHTLSRERFDERLQRQISRFNALDPIKVFMLTTGPSYAMLEPEEAREFMGRMEPFVPALRAMHMSMSAELSDDAKQRARRVYGRMPSA